LANYTQEYEKMVKWLTNLDIQTTSPQATKTFEYSIRVLGGLLGAYSLSGDTRLFAAARNAADAILEGPFQASPTIVPRPFNVRRSLQLMILSFSLRPVCFLIFF